MLTCTTGHQRRVVTERVSAFVPLLHVLFRSNVTIRRTLQILDARTRGLLPRLADRLHLILTQISSNLRLNRRLGRDTGLLTISRFGSAYIVLRRLVRRNNNTVGSLLTLGRLLSSQHLARRRRCVSGVSTGVSIIVVIFLFPTLLVILNNPNFATVTHTFNS